jgi:hypothetical protein
MDTKSVTDDVKAEVSKGIEKLGTLRDEVKLHLHLASLDAKQEWDEKLEPRINDVQNTAHQVTESSRTAVQEALTRVEAFVAKLRAGVPASSKA